MQINQPFNWQRYRRAERFLFDRISAAGRKSPMFQNLTENIVRRTSSKIIDWLDHLTLPESASTKRLLTEAGFIPNSETDQNAYLHPEARFPQVVLRGNYRSRQQGLVLRVENIAEFCQINGFATEISGPVLSPFRRADFAEQGGVILSAVERRGTLGFETGPSRKDYSQSYHWAYELWQLRPRQHVGSEAVFAAMAVRSRKMVKKLGPDLAAHIICSAERDYWQARNRAARMQRSRQDTMGLGWANHDHHTFRSSRRWFKELVQFFLQLGFVRRERFYAGKEAGWGAQVMENRRAGLTLFLDVDLAPEEIVIDFDRIELEERDHLGTVGLWCALHGDSVCSAGMHHLAALYDFTELNQDIKEYGAQFMSPFSSFSYLKQAFSKGEMWPVEQARLDQLLTAKRITSKQAEKFAERGSIGSHLENIERREGYQGFNRKNVSNIIRKTDPRHQRG